jgi:sugar-specific transcriptional regulator TrmB
MMVLNAKEESVLRHLEELGLSLYEGKAYFSCLVLGRAKVREIARYSSVPQSKIYYVLERLEEKGLIEIEEERPKHVKAIPVKELAYRMVERRRKQIDNIRIAEKELEEIVETISPIIRENNSKYIRLFKPRYRM